MGVLHDAFLAGDVYIDFPYEEAMFRFEKSTGKIYRRFYGQPCEVELDAKSQLFAEACVAGTQVTPDVYRAGRARTSR